ncbi:MAG: NAD(P)H-binding protein [Acidobacteriota bacterium]
MSFVPERVAVIGATGPTGYHLVRELAGRGRAVVAVSRRQAQLEELFDDEGVEIATADALDAEATGRAIVGCGLVVDCIGLPPERMADHPKTAAVITQAAEQAEARCLQISSYWAFFPQRQEVMSESHPRAGGHEWFRMRREAEDVMLSAGAAVVHLPDFFGPRVHTSTVQNALQEAMDGKPMNWLGRSDTPREAAFVPDAMRIVADLSERDEAYGTDWALPGSGQISADQVAKLASEHLGRPVKVRAASGLMLKVLSRLHPGLRQIAAMIPQYIQPVRYDTTKLEGLLGKPETTPFDRAIPGTLDWLAGG